MVSEFKIARSRAGVFHFGYVRVQIESSSKSQIINSIHKPVNTNNAEIDETHTEWFDAAVNGIRSALQYISRYTDEKFIVEIVCIKGVEVDTRSEDIKKCAFMAVAKAILDPQSQTH
jgi:hypothetical protein